MHTKKDVFVDRSDEKKRLDRSKQLLRRLNGGRHRYVLPQMRKYLVSKK